ncbi:hypothetical protein GOP47_0006954 [Adiantum capillus-veneris]|uniref:Uncharacterized protein n=1 Tax=Adiantum capillus-veneris TaxID=13818 RepID=A0A9D4UZS3_ADICA|nr:hypothetical protein GOP47_0006954 [Adiantum capillus-veneris]
MAFRAANVICAPNVVRRVALVTELRLVRDITGWGGSGEAPLKSPSCHSDPDRPLGGVFVMWVGVRVFLLLLYRDWMARAILFGWSFQLLFLPSW